MLNFISAYTSYSYNSDLETTATVIKVMFIMSIVLALAGAICLLLIFLPRKNQYKFNGFIGWLFKFLNFDLLLSESLLKGLYIFATIFNTIFSFTFIFIEPKTGILVFLLLISLGNILLRIVYEFLLVKLIICRNTSEINRKLGKGEDPNAVYNENYTQFIDISIPKKAKNYNNSSDTAYNYTPNYQYNNAEQQNPIPENNNFQPPAGTTIFCPHCGKQIDAQNINCPFCGNRVN